MNRNVEFDKSASSQFIYSLQDVDKQRSNERSYRLHLRHLKVAAGDKIAITGPSGCGKSTTLDILGLGLEPDSAAQFLFNPDGQPGALSVMKLWQAGRGDALADLRLGSMGYVLQTGDLLPYLNTIDNIILPCVLAGMHRPKAIARAKDLAQRLGLENVLAAMPSTLSIGERQRVAIARALAPHPAVILADEPTAALDPLHAARVMDIFLEAVDDLGTTLILVTHNEQWAQNGRLKILRFRVSEEDDCVTAILDDREAAFGTSI